MLFIFFLLFQSVVSQNTNNRIIKNYNTHYVELYNNYNNNSYILDNGFDELDIISNYSSIEKCKNECSNITKCVSVYEYKIQNKLVVIY